MDVVPLCVFRTTSVLWQQRKGAWVQTIICKGTFDLLPGQAVLSADQEDINEHDNYWDDDPARSLYSPSDVAPFKPRCDVLLVGHAFAPKGEPVKSLTARMTVGEISKAIEVYGERAWTSNGLLRETARFSKMPLRYERAGGGPMTWNPVGVRADVRSEGGLITVPNLQVPGIFLAEPGQFLEPVGFGPIAPTWPPRRHRLGHHAASWNDTNWRKEPIPADVDTGFWNSAPRDQQTVVLRANERIVLEHLHPEHPELTTVLPGLFPRAFVDPGGNEPAQELPMSCDTLWIDTDRALCTLTFRACLPLDHLNQSGRILIALEGPSKRLDWPDIRQLLEAAGTPHGKGGPGASKAAAQGDDEAELVEPESEDDPALQTTVHPGLAAAAEAHTQQGPRTTAQLETLTAATKVAQPKANAPKPKPKASLPTMILSDVVTNAVPLQPLHGRRPLETLPDSELEDSNRETALPPEPNQAPAIPFVSAPNTSANTANPIQLPQPAPSPRSHAALSAAQVIASATKTAPPPPPAPPAPPSPSPDAEAGRIRFGVPPLPSTPHSAAVPADAVPTWLNKGQTPAHPPAPAIPALPTIPTPPPPPLPASSAPRIHIPSPPSPKSPPPMNPAVLAVAANAALGGALAASNAAAHAEQAPEPSPDKAPMVIPKTYAPHTHAREACHLLWYDPAPQALTEIRAVPEWKAILNELHAEQRKRKSDDPFDFDEEAPPEAPPEVQNRRDVFAILTRANSTDPDSLGMLLMEAVTDDGSFIPPLVLLSGEMVFPFDEVETLKATVTAATPFAGGDNKKLKETIDTANELLKTPWIHSSSGVADGMTQKVRDAFSQSARMLPAGYLDMHTSRVLLEQRHYQKRSVFGEESIRCEFTPVLSSIAIPAYLPSSLSKQLPMFQRFRSRIIAEAHVQQDQFESHPSALRVIALGRQMTLSNRPAPGR